MRERGATLARWLTRRDGEPRLVVPALVVLAVAFALAWAVQLLTRTTPTDEARAASMSSSERFDDAEGAYVRLLDQHPSVPLVLALLDNHGRALAARIKREQAGDAPPGAVDATRVMPDEQLDALIERLPPEIALVGRFVRADGSDADRLREELESGARRVPPVPWYNHVLGDAAMRDSRARDAASYFEREGLAFPERQGDLGVALTLWMDEDDWDTVRERLADPRVAAAADANSKARLAEHDGDWWGAAKWTVADYGGRLAPSSFALAGVAALAWGFFCARLGKVGERPLRRVGFYLAAFVLGIASVVPTVLLIELETAKVHLVETGDVTRDIIYFVFGVGLREEASKLLLFAVLLPGLRRWGDKLDVLVCGAFVGLGFASEENLSYLADGDLRTGLGRFLTANFFHMAMTGTLAAALDDMLTGVSLSTDFSRTALFVIGLHGAYDFLLSHDEMGGGYLAMGVMFLVGRIFLDALDRARKGPDRGLSPLHAFLFSVAAVTGVSIAHAVAAVGPRQAAMVMGEGLEGEAIILLAFAGALRAM
jgi:RsiW-degrading membrane proteinase PrsW (M82 family)